jgi:NDP-sugar pyrophosphorylase family protein
MEAMILAAGLGTRLRPVTDTVPKALVEVAGVPMLERVARSLVAAGADRLIINVHHHADQIEAFVAGRKGFGVPYAISREVGETPLETGGGLLHARDHFRSAEPFFLHNVDVISDMDLAGMYRDHVARRPLVTLAVHERDTTRPLLFDRRGLYGWADRRPGREAEQRVRAPDGPSREWGFAGVHVIDPRVFGLLTESGKFSIIPPYLRLAGAGHEIRPYDVSGATWLEIGSVERLEEARRLLS